MLSLDTKKKIDSARDVLVGKIPNPQSQVEQITTALIYKFMDDMDERAKSLGGKPRFFIGEFEKYSWRKILDPRIGGQERMNLYSEAVQKLSQNSALPQLFRDVFKDAFVPYRDPETLSLFLKEINWFDYHHSEELGNAYEYLLSIMGSQGDAGQFRTPRHIIDFIVSAIDPKKDETVLDPACGTAGFLISAYNHIINKNNGQENDNVSSLTPDERAKLLKNFTGYDIGPEMVRLSLVNMYLHGFVQPRIEEYDTLTYEDHWSDDYDVILANPPFMTPKGGVRPHKKFQIQANRTEVLFVDYIAEHLKPNGRAGIVVPEGIIFQRGATYTNLRKLILEKGLYAVISLPVGVFNPYTKTTKTSILLIDKKVQKQTGGVTFIKVENDGYDLGAERKPIKENDLPEALSAITSLKNFGKVPEHTSLGTVYLSVADILARTSSNLAVLHDLEEVVDGRYKSVRLGDILQQVKRNIKVDDDTEYKQVTVKMNGKGAALRKIISGSSIKTKGQFLVSAGDFILSKIDARNGAFAIVPEELDGAIVTQDFPVFTVNEAVMDRSFLNLVMQSPQFIDICKRTSVGTSNRRRVRLDYFLEAKIPLPDLNTQNTILKKLSSYEEEILAHEVKIKGLQSEKELIVQEVWGD